MKRLSPFVLILLASAAAAQAYRWVDKDGKVHYSDAPPPPADASKVEQKRLNASVLPSGGPMTYEMRRAVELFPVALHTSPDCGDPCKSGRDYLKKRAVPFAEKSLATKADEEALKKLSGGSMSVPTLVVGTQVQKGYEEGRWGGLLDDAGYPPAR